MGRVAKLRVSSARVSSARVSSARVSSARVSGRTSSNTLGGKGGIDCFSNNQHHIMMWMRGGPDDLERSCWLLTGNSKIKRHCKQSQKLQSLSASSSASLLWWSRSSVHCKAKPYSAERWTRCWFFLIKKNLHQYPPIFIHLLYIKGV